MSQTGKKNTRNKPGTKSKKNTISQLKQEQFLGEQEYTQLIENINNHYDDLIKSIQDERDEIIKRLDRVFLLKSSFINNKIQSSEITLAADLSSSLSPEYFFREVRYPIANFNSHAYLLNHIFLADECITRKSFLNGFTFDFIRAAKFQGKYYYLASDSDNLIYRSDCWELSNVSPMRIVKASKSKKSKRKSKIENWGVEPTQYDLGNWESTLDWNASIPEDNAVDLWDIPVGQNTEWDSVNDEASWSNNWSQNSSSENSLKPLGQPFDFTIAKSRYLFITFEMSGKIGLSQLIHGNYKLDKFNYTSIAFISQPKGICILESTSELVLIADASCHKVSAIQTDDFIKFANEYYATELNCEFNVQFGSLESPLLLHENDIKQEFLILTVSGTIYTVSATGIVLSMLPYSEFISPYSMVIMESGSILIVDLESLVVLDSNGRCMDKYFSGIFSYRGCINTTGNSIEFITRVEDAGSTGLVNFEISLSD